jgi:hypothetical protein
MPDELTPDPELMTLATAQVAALFDLKRDLIVKGEALTKKNMIATLYAILRSDAEKRQAAPEKKRQRAKPLTIAEKVDAFPIYEAYPRHIAPEAAQAAIVKALRKVEDDETWNRAEFGSAFDFLLARTKLFAGAVSRWPASDHEYIPHPRTWYNQGRYNDDPREWTRGKFAMPSPKPMEQANDEPQGWREWVRENASNTEHADRPWAALDRSAQTYIRQQLGKQSAA